MNNIELSEDALMEALTIIRELKTPVHPPHYWRGGLREDFWSMYNKPGVDIVYYNSLGKEHRIYGPARISKAYSYEFWKKDGKFHRVDGPAYVCKKNKIWFLDGKLHRLDGPAVDIVGHHKEYWIGGQQWSPRNYKKEIERRKRKGLIK